MCPPLNDDSVSPIATVPGDFPEVLGSLTQQGYRVLAVAHRPLHMAWHKAERVKRYKYPSFLSSTPSLLFLPIMTVQVT